MKRFILTIVENRETSIKVAETKEKAEKLLQEEINSRFDEDDIQEYTENGDLEVEKDYAWASYDDYHLDLNIHEIEV